MRIAIDAMGGDYAPEPIVQGALDALAGDESLHLILVGDQSRLEPLLTLSDQNRNRVELVHTDQVVGMDESPAKSMRAKPRSTINLCWQLLKEERVEGIVSAGNTGAVVAGGLLSRRFLKFIQRPGIAVSMPTPTGHSVMIDVGANVHPKPEQLFQYAVMGRVYARQFYNIENPTVGLLNIGSEEDKGHSLAKETAGLFAQSHLKDRFYGNIEGRDVCRGVVDVIITDGFTGNIALKCCEGMVDILMTCFQQQVLPQLQAERELATQALHEMFKRYAYHEAGGAPLLGIDGVCLICHGSSDRRAIRNAVAATKKLGTINKLIVTEMEMEMAQLPKDAIPATPTNST